MSLLLASSTLPQQPGPGRSRYGFGAIVRHLVLLALWMAGFAPSEGADTAGLEIQVKAALLPKLAAFVEWPASSFTNDTAPIRLAVIGDAAFTADFDQAIQNQTANGRRLVVERPKSLEGLTGFHIVFLSSTEKARLAQVVQATRGQPILTIGDLEGFAGAGGVMNFIRVEGKIRFEVNIDSAAEKNLKISSKLLQVSRIVRPSGATPKS